MKVAGKVALITGGTGGLGKAFAKALLNGNAAAVSGLNLHISPLLHPYNHSRNIYFDSAITILSSVLDYVVVS